MLYLHLVFIFHTAYLTSLIYQLTEQCPLGAIVSSILILKGFDPWLSLLIAFGFGLLAGCLTGVLHVKLKLQPLLSGILVYTLLLSINLVLIKFGTGGQSIASIFGQKTIFNSGSSKIFCHQQ